jgi:hypothetical protein
MILDKSSPILGKGRCFSYELYFQSIILIISE